MTSVDAREGALIPQILSAYRDGDIEAETMQQLTLATVKQQIRAIGLTMLIPVYTKGLDADYGRSLTE